MEYDEKEFEGENVELKVYGVARFEFDDSIEGQLRFGSLVENEVFLGITDSHWIEEYSRGGNGIELSSSRNVWSEAGCSESVEMLLKSEKTREELDEAMDPNLSQDDGKEHVVSSVGVVSEGYKDLANEQVAENIGASTEELKLQQVADHASGAAEESIEIKENSTAVAVDHSKEKSEISIPMNEEPPTSSLLPAADTLQGNAPISPLEIENSSVNLPETGGEDACWPDEQVSDHEGVAIAAADDEDTGIICKSEPDAVHVDQELPLLQNVQPSLSTSVNVIAAPPHSGVPDQADPVTAMEADKSSSTAETDDQPKSPILGVSLVHQEKVDRSSQAAESGVAKSSFEKEASPDLAEKVDVHSTSLGLGLVDSSNAKEIEPPSESNTPPPSGNNSDVGGGGLPDPKESAIPVNHSNNVDADGGSLEKPQIVPPTSHISTMELPKDKQETTTTTDDSLLPCKTADDLEGNIQPLDATKDVTFEGAVFGQDSPTFQASTVPKEGPTPTPTTDGSSSQVDVASQMGVKGKASSRRKSVGKEKANRLKETTTPPGQVIQFMNENVGSKPRLPDLNSSTSISLFQQQPFTDNQQVQLRAQILVYGSLISGSPPEEPHMSAAFGQSDGGRIWEGVWRACLDRLHVQKAQAIANTPPTTQLRSVDEGGVIHKHKHAAASVQNSSPSNNNNYKGTATTTPSPMIPLSSPLWSIATPSSSSAARLQALSPFQAPTAAVGGVGHNNPYWLSRGVGPLPLPLPFAAQWVATSPIPAFNAGPITPLKESKHTSATPVVLNSGLEVSGMYNQPSTDSKSRKRKKAAASVSHPTLPIHLPQGMVSINQTDSVTAPAAVTTSAFMTSKSSPPVKFPFASSPNPTSGAGVEKAVISEETLSKVEECKMQAREAAERAVSDCHGVWRQLERRGLSGDDEAKLVSSAVSLAAAASVAKVAAAAAKIASDLATSLYLSNTRSQMISPNPNPNANVDDAIVKAAQLAAEAVSEAGKIVAMSEPFPLRHLVEAGPEGYWKTPAGNSNAEAAFQKGVSSRPNPDNNNNNKRKPRGVRKGRDQSKTIPESDIGSCTDENNNIREGSLVEVYKDDDGAWFGAHVLSLKDGKALVCYAEIQSDEGGQLKEWVPLGVPPKTRVARPLTLEGTKKRSRTVATDFVWSTGDPVDVWMHDRWREGVVVETNKIDPTCLTVKFPGQGETSSVGSWFVRPTLIWKDHKWVECNTASSAPFKGGDTPNEKRMKLAFMESSNRKEEKVVESKKQEEPTTLPLSVKETLFSVGSNANARRDGGRIGLQKGVVFGVPKPGKKQKFMDVSKHYDVGDGSDKNNHRPTATATATATSTRHHHHDSSSVKFTRYLIPQAPRGMKNNSAKEKQTAAAAETRPRIPRKPPVPSLRTLLTSTTTNKTTTPVPAPHSVSDDDNQSSGHQNQREFDAPLSRNAAETRKTTTRSERVNKRKFVSAAGKEEEEEALSAPEHHQVEPSRRSNRKIQPTSRLLEGLQSSITISKIPSASHSTQRTTHPKSTPKGNTNNA